MLVDHKASKNEAVAIRPARITDAAALSSLMMKAIDWGHLRDLGPRFVTLLHRHMILSRYCSCYVAERDGVVIGYTAWSTDTSSFYREFLLRRGIIAALVLISKVFQPRSLKVVLRGLTYFPQEHTGDPKAEILSFAVCSEITKSGVGSAIFRAIAQEFKSRGVERIKIGTVATTNKGANVFYRRMGCELIRTVPFYNDTSVNVYIYRII
jgi:ribosomal protein S18 acetylase RimI-like enzyme